MKLPHLFLCLLLASPLAPAIDAYLVAGQSNGWRLSTLAPGPPAAPDATPNARIHYFGMECVSEPAASKLQTLETLAPRRMGTGLATALLNQADGKDIVIIQYCRCGASILGENEKSWWPGEDPRNGKNFDAGLFGQFEKYLADARRQVKEQLGEDLEFKGLFWHQGESNAGGDPAVLADTYDKVFWRLRKAIGDPDLPLVAGHIRDLGPKQQVVNQTLDRLAARDPNMTTVGLHDLAYEADRNGKPDVHIALTGCHEFGLRLAAAHRRLTQGTFHAYLPSRSSKQLLIVQAQPDQDAPNKLKLAIEKRIDLDFPPVAICAHPTRSLLYLAGNSGEPGQTPGATIELDEDGSFVKTHPAKLGHGYCYLSVDHSHRYLLGCSYRGGQVDLHPLNEKGIPGPLSDGLDEGRTNAHCVLLSPDNRFAYIPYVKDNNALLQYRFDPTSGTLDALEPKNANPPEGTGPCHLAYHPRKPFLYFSNEQGVGASVYRQAEDGQLTFLQNCKVLPEGTDTTGLSASDIVITGDGRFLFTGLRGAKRSMDGISRYRIKDDGRLEFLGITKADQVPWGMTLSPDQRHLLVTAFAGGTLSAYQIGEKGKLSVAGQIEIDEKISDLVTR